MILSATPNGPHATPPRFTSAETERWPNFTAEELACKNSQRGCVFCKGEYFHDPGFLDALQRLRWAMKAPLHITSGRRCKNKNRAVGGASRSEHTLAMAVDIRLAGHDPVRLAREARIAGFRGIGFGKTFLHVDMGRIHGARVWHYQAGAIRNWSKWFGFDPVARFKQTGRF